MSKKIDYDYLKHNARVVADSGQIGNSFLSDRNITMLKRGNLWNSCVFFVDGIDGKKLDYDGTVSKIYDLKSNADLTQNVYSGQPSILDDGVLKTTGTQYMVSPVLGVGNPIRDTVNNFSICGSFVRSADVNLAQIILTRNTSATNRIFGCYIAANNDATSPNKFRFIICNADGTPMKLYYGSTTLALNTQYFYTANWNGTVATLQINGADETLTDFGGYTGSGDVGNTDTAVSIGAWSDGQFPLTGNIGVQMIFNKLLSAEDKAYVYKNFSMNKLSNIVSSSTESYITSVEADSGQVKYPLLVEEQMQKLVNSGFWSNCIYYHDGIGGKKVDSANSVSKIYDWCPNTKHNLVQATALNQPKMMTAGDIMHNSSYLSSGNLSVGDNIRTLTNNFSWGCWFNANLQTIKAGQTIFGRWGIQNYCWSIQRSVNTINRIYFSVSSTTGANTVRRYETSFDVCDDTWHFALFTFASGNIKIYIDGVEDTNPTKVVDGAVFTMYDNQEPLAEGFGFIGRTGTCMGFNKVLSQAEITWLYENTNTTNRINKMFSSDTVAHINRVENTNLLMTATSAHCYITDPNFIETLFTKMKDYNLTTYCKLLCFADGGIIDLGSGLVRGIFNLMDTGIDNRGSADPTYQPTLYTSPFEKGRKGLLNQLSTAYSGIRFTSSEMKGIFRNQTKGAMISVMRKIANGAVGSSIYNGFSNNSSTLSSRFAHQQIYGTSASNYTPRTNLKTLDASVTQVFTSANRDVTVSTVQLTFADWQNKQITTWINGTLGENATVFTTDDAPTSDTDSYFVFMGANPSVATGATVCYGVSFFMSAFNGDFDINNINLLEAVIRDYYGVV